MYYLPSKHKNQRYTQITIKKCIQIKQIKKCHIYRWAGDLSCYIYSLQTESLKAVKRIFLNEKTKSYHIPWHQQMT